MKQSRVTPIFKKGDRFETGNYGHISVIPAILKVFERLIHDQRLVISCHMANRALGQITLLKLCLLDVSDYLLQNINEGMNTSAIFLD